MTKILIIEDDFSLAENLQALLKTKGFEVESAPDGEIGISKAKAFMPEIVLLDIMIPDKTGVEVLEDLRGQDGSGLPGSKIVIMTNFEQDDATRQSMERLADGYLIKAEITPKRLVNIIKSFENQPAE